MYHQDTGSFVILVYLTLMMVRMSMIQQWPQTTTAFVSPIVLRLRNQDPQSVYDTTSTTTTTTTTTIRDTKDRRQDCDNDNEEEEWSVRERIEATTPPDMKYVPRNLQRQGLNFGKLRQVLVADNSLAGTPNKKSDLLHDVYVRQPDTEIYWFLGKVARVSDVSLEDCIGKQWPLLEQHAIHLRPLELYAHYGSLQLYVAPGDSELDVAYNRPDIVFQKMTRPTSPPPIKNNLVGFQGEVYEPGEDGFRTWRTDDGKPAKPEIKGPAVDNATDTDNDNDTQELDMDQLQELLKGQDLNELYKEQQRRQGIEVIDDDDDDEE